MLVIRCDVRINHRRLDVLVPKQSLGGSDVRSCCKQMARKTMPQRMRTDMLVNLRLLHSAFECSTKRTGRRMPSRHLLAIEPGPNHHLREDELPGQRPGGGRILSVQGIGHRREAVSAKHVRFV
jgi:hypothetical protein